MKRIDTNINMKQAVILLVSFIVLVLGANSTMNYAARSRAAASVLDLTVSLDGTFASGTTPEYKTTVVLYSERGQIKTYTDQVLSLVQGNIFKTSVELSDLFLNQKYAVYIKPDKYLGKVFCSENKTGNDCGKPEIVLTYGGVNLDVSNTPLIPGDIAKQDGWVGAYDIAKVIDDYGGFGDGYIETDVNTDGVVNMGDYSRIVQSITENAADDPVNIVYREGVTPMPLNGTPTVHSETVTPTLASTATPFENIIVTVSPSPTFSPSMTPGDALISGTPTITPSEYPTDTPTPVPTLPPNTTATTAPSSTIAPTNTLVPQPTNTSVPQPTNTSVPTTTHTPIPTSTPVPTATAIPTPTPTVIESGTCKITVNGQVYINAVIYGSVCKQLTNEDGHYCVEKESDCSPTRCDTYFRDLVKYTLNQCAGAFASLDDGKTTITCEVEFMPGQCAPEDPPGCQDNWPSC